MSTGLAPGLARKVNKILDIRTESPEILNALSTLSAFYDSNNALERRKLRSTVERRGVSINEEYLAAANQVVQALDLIQMDLDGLTKSCQTSRRVVIGARESTASLLADTEKLQREMASNEKRSELVQQFLEQYQLSAGEVAALQAAEIGEAFFTALDRVRAIHANCKALLRTHHQRAGLELMDAMSSHQETAYERLCRWVQSECRTLAEMDAPEVSPTLQQAARALQDRPVLLKYCAMEVATTRHNALFQRFIAALTRGGSGGMPRPIEMHAHDPRRYLGDMLAWVHQSLASERELLVGLFGDEGQSAAPNTLSTPSSTPEMPRISSLLDRVFECICRPIKVRIEQVLMATPPLLLCFSVSQLLAFYTSLVDRLLGSSASLTQTLAGCRQLASRVFQEQLKGAGDKLLRYPPPPPKELTPPQQLTEALQQLSEIIASFEASYDAAEGESGEAELAPILAAAVDPIVEVIHRSSEALNSSAPSRVDEQLVDPSLQRVYQINCLTALEQVLVGHSSCAGKAKLLSRDIEGHLAAVVRSHAGNVLVKSGLAEIVDRMRIYRSGKSNREAVMADDSALALPRVSQALKTFIGLLSKPEAQPEFRNVQVPRVRTQAVTRVAVALSDAYQLVHDCLTDPACGYTDDPEVANALKHSPEEVRTILGIV